MRIRMGAQCRWVLAAGAIVGLLLLSQPAAAQTTGIAGIVRDTSGAVLPGVTVEASSPALIEKTRAAVTDGEGQYNIVDLRPGTYTVTFTLPGFSTVVRNGIELPTAFTATVSVSLQVGSVAETITVTGDAPTIDVHNTIQRQVVTREVMDALPSARNFESIGQVIPGVVPTNPNRPSGQDVGGLAGERGHISIHGGNPQDQMSELDGFSWLPVDGGNSGYTANPAEVQEFNFQLSGHMSETPNGGVRINLIPKEGGNRFSAFFFGNFSNSSLQSNNLSDELIARGLKSVNKINKLWDFNPAVGGPVMKDKLWFFASFRHLVDEYAVADMYYPKDPKAYIYEADRTRPAVNDSWLSSTGLRLTWQASAKNKFAAYYSNQPRCQCHQFISAQRTPEASSRQSIRGGLGNWIGQVTWKSPVTNRLLLEGGMMKVQYAVEAGRQPDVSGDTLSVTELSTGLIYRASDVYNFFNIIVSRYKGAMSYVTGSHAFKVGADLDYRPRNTTDLFVNGDVNLSLFNGIPRQVTVYSTPRTTLTGPTKNVGLYAQDQWKYRRVTANMGLRFDYFNGQNPAVSLPAGRFVPARDYPGNTDVPSWKDLSPRLGINYDLFGTGKTAVKASFSRYENKAGANYASANAPAGREVVSTTRPWTDDNHDFIPQDNELGALANSNFGRAVVNTSYDEALRSGWGLRPYNMEFMVGVQHELLPRVSADVAYFRRVYGNQSVTDNLAVTPADYDQYCITGPTDARLPGGGGSQICDLYDLKPSKIGQTNNLVTFAKNYGDYKQQYNGMDVTLNARLPQRITHCRRHQRRHLHHQQCRDAGSRRAVALDVTLFRGRLAAGAAVLRSAGAVAGAGEVSRNHAAASRCRGQRDVSDQSGPDGSRDLHRDQRPGPAIARPQPCRRRDDHRSDCAQFTDWRADVPGRSAARQGLPIYRLACQSSGRLVQRVELERGAPREPDLRALLADTDVDHAGTAHQVRGGAELLIHSWRVAVASVLLMVSAGVIRPAAVGPEPQTAAPAGSERDLLARYCVTCHNARLRTAGLALDALNLTNVGEDADTWEKVVRKLRSGAMPPSGRPQPDKPVREAFVAWLEDSLDAAARAHPDPGRPATLHRLNRAEYKNAIRDLLSLDVDVSSLLPSDPASYGFDNIGDVLGMPPVLLERYLSAARTISRLAIGDTSLPPATETYRIPSDLTQDDRFDGLPLGTRGGKLIRHYFPLDGEYRISLRLARDSVDNLLLGVAEPHQIEVRVDGERVRVFTVGGQRMSRAALMLENADAGLDVPVPVKAGLRSVGVAFLKEASAEVDKVRQPFLKASPENGDTHGLPYLRTVTISGPLDVTGPGDTLSRRRIFSCRPAKLGRRIALRQADSLDTGAARLPPSADRDRPRGSARLLHHRAGRRRVRARHPAGAAPDVDQSRLPVSHRTGPPGAAGENGLSDQRRRAGVPAVVFPVEQHSRR